MDEDTLHDLKQFIAATVSQQLAQQTAELHNEFKVEFSEIRKNIDKLDKKMDSLTAFVTEAIDTSNEVNGTQLKDHERRITKLERATAA